MKRVWSWRQAIWESELAATTKIVLQALASHLNDMGEPMFPSQARLAQMCSLSERAVIQHLQIAEERGWIKPRKRELKGSKWAANEYVAAWPDGVNDVHPWGEGGSPGGVNEVHTNSPVLTSKEPTARACRFDEFWNEYPTKVDKKGCQRIWKSRKLDGLADEIIAGIKRWQSSDRWRRGFITNPSTFLNQERWKDTPPAAVTERGEIAVREIPPAQAAAARADVAAFEEFKRLSRLHPRKCDAEIWQMVGNVEQDRKVGGV